MVASGPKKASEISLGVKKKRKGSVGINSQGNGATASNSSSRRVGQMTEQVMRAYGVPKPSAPTDAATANSKHAVGHVVLVTHLPIHFNELTIIYSNSDTVESRLGSQTIGIDIDLQ